ncbi:Hypothetical protein A7982_02941 [Minicystis rosea]|nr:Hypothetical protein A7982_02941 [Minicystis rosea]
MALHFASAEESTASTNPADLGRASRDPRALRILAKSIYRELRGGGLAEEDVMAIAGDLLGLVAGDVKDRRRNATDTTAR